MYIRRKVFSLLQDENGEERYFSTTDYEYQKEFGNRENKAARKAWEAQQGENYHTLEYDQAKKTIPLGQYGNSGYEGRQAVYRSIARGRNVSTCADPNQFIDRARKGKFVGIADNNGIVGTTTLTHGVDSKINAKSAIRNNGIAGINKGINQVNVGITKNPKFNKQVGIIAGLPQRTQIQVG